jgi:HK97 family phage major capsid protein
MPGITKEQVQNTWMIWAGKVSDLNNQLNVGLVDDSLTKEQFETKRAARDEAVKMRDLALEQLKQFGEDEPNPDNNDKGHEVKSLKNNKEQAKADLFKHINNFVHARHIMNDGSNGEVTSTVVSPTIPEEIIYNPAAEVNSVVDLSTLITRTPVVTASGKSPILARADYVFPTVEELKENPNLPGPQFTEVAWEVKTHRGALAISNEAIQDSAVDVSGLVTNQLAEARVNTYNSVITGVLGGFNKATASTDNLTDAYKWLLNVGLDPAYSPSIIASQTMYNALDTLKDKNGQYIFHQDITGKSGDNLLGIPVYKVGDTLLGKAGEAHAFIGDLSRSLFFADRQQITLSWQYNEAYGQYLAGALRFGVSPADVNAGYFLTADVPASSIVKPTITPTQGSTVAADTTQSGSGK